MNAFVCVCWAIVVAERLTLSKARGELESDRWTTIIWWMLTTRFERGSGTERSGCRRIGRGQTWNATTPRHHRTTLTSMIFKSSFQSLSPCFLLAWFGKGTSICRHGVYLARVYFFSFSDFFAILCLRYLSTLESSHIVLVLVLVLVLCCTYYISASCCLWPIDSHSLLQLFCSAVLHIRNSLSLKLKVVDTTSSLER